MTPDLPHAIKDAQHAAAQLDAMLRSASNLSDAQRTLLTETTQCLRRNARSLAQAGDALACAPQLTNANPDEQPLQAALYKGQHGWALADRDTSLAFLKAARQAGLGLKEAQWTTTPSEQQAWVVYADIAEAGRRFPAEKTPVRLMCRLQEPAPDASTRFDVQDEIILDRHTGLGWERSVSEPLTRDQAMALPEEIQRRHRNSRLETIARRLGWQETPDGRLSHPASGQIVDTWSLAIDRSLHLGLISQQALSAAVPQHPVPAAGPVQAQASVAELLRALTASFPRPRA